MNIELILDGYKVPYAEADGLRRFTINKSNDNRKPFTSDVTFYGAARQIILDKIINTANPNTSKVDINIYVDGSLKIEAEVTGKGLEFVVGDCQNEDNCGVTCKIIEKKNKLSYFKQHLAHLGMPISGHPIIYMNKDVGELNELFAKILQIIWITLSPIALTWASALKSINRIIKALRVIGIRLNTIAIAEDKNQFQLAFEIAKDITLSIDRVYKYPSPYVRDYIQNALDYTTTQTGESYTFVSSVLNNPSSDYYNVVYFHAPVERGNINSTDLISANRPAKTMDTFMDEICGFYGLEWRFVGNTFYVEPPYFFETIGNEFDLTGECMKLTPRQVNYPARLKIGYQKDLLDQPESYYEVDWNNPENTTQEGLEIIDFLFGWAKVGEFTGLFGGGFNQPILEMKDTISTLPKLLLCDSNGVLLLDQSIMQAEEIYNRFHTHKNPRSEDFKKFECNITLDICDYPDLDKDSKLLYQNKTIEIESIEFEISPDEQINITGLIGQIQVN